MNHRKKLIKILKDYKGKNSLLKLKVVQASLRRLERDISTYGDFKKAYFEDLKSLYGKKEIYSSTKESTAELNLWEEVSDVVSKWSDGAPLDNDRYNEIHDIYKKYGKSISKEKDKVLFEMMRTLCGTCGRYTCRVSKIRAGNIAYSRVVGKVKEMNQFRAVPSYDESLERRLHEDFENDWRTFLTLLRAGWVEFGGNDLQSGVRTLAKMIGTYSAHYKKGSKAIDDLYEYLLKGFGICFISKDFYDKLTPADFPEVKGSVPAVSAALEATKQQMIRSNTKQYNTSNIQAFIEQLKREKF